MSENPKDTKRWPARRIAEVVTEIINCTTTASEVARTHDPTIGEVKQWKADSIHMGSEALRPHSLDAEANT